MNQPNNLARRPHAKILVPIHKNLPPPLPTHQWPHLLELPRRRLLLNLHRLIRHLVLKQPARVLPPPQHQLRVRLLRVHDRLLDVMVDRCFDRTHEACSHVDTLGAERERGCQALAVGETSTSDERHLQALPGAGEEDEVRDVGFTDVPCALEAVDAEEVDAEFDGGDGVADGGALVQDDDAGLLEHFDDGPGGVAGGFDDLDAFVDHDLGVLGVRGCVHGGEEGDVDAEGERGHAFAFADFEAEVLGGRLGEGGQLVGWEVSLVVR